MFPNEDIHEPDGSPVNRGEVHMSVIALADFRLSRGELTDSERDGFIDALVDIEDIEEVTA